MPRMRTIKAAVNEIKAADPGTAFTEHALRRMIITGAIPSVMAGSRYLVDLDTLERYLGSEIQTVVSART